MSKLFFACVLFFSGCMVPCEKKEDTDTSYDPPAEPVAAPNFTVELPDDAWAMVVKYLPENAITLEKAIQIEEEGMKISVPAGTKLSFSVGSDMAVCTLSEPYPSIQKWFINVTGLRGFNLKPSGDGVAKTGLGEWAFRWLDNGAGVAAAEEKKPEMLMYSFDGCAAGVRAKKELDEAEKVGKLPFLVRVVKDEKEVCPTFKWKTGNQWYTPSLPDGTPRPGWYGVDDLIACYKASLPKK